MHTNTPLRSKGRAACLNVGTIAACDTCPESLRFGGCPQEPSSPRRLLCSEGVWVAGGQVRSPVGTSGPGAGRGVLECEAESKPRKMPLLTWEGGRHRKDGSDGRQGCAVGGNVHCCSHGGKLESSRN